jgi:glycine cleavage system H protein
MMNVPENLKYTKDHEWVKVEGGVATMGITDFAQQQLTDIVFVELPAVGAKAVAGKAIATVESVKAVSDVFSPLNGEVVEVNESLPDAPELLNKSPYDDAWLAKIKMDNPADAEVLLSSAAYKELIAAEGH